MSCSSASCLRKEVVRALSSCLDSFGVSGTLGCAKMLKFAASVAAGRSRRWGDGWTIAVYAGGVCWVEVYSGLSVFELGRCPWRVDGGSNPERLPRRSIASLPMCRGCQECVRIWTLRERRNWLDVVRVLEGCPGRRG